MKLTFRFVAIGLYGVPSFRSPPPPQVHNSSSHWYIYIQYGQRESLRWIFFSMVARFYGYLLAHIRGLRGKKHHHAEKRDRVEKNGNEDNSFYSYIREHVLPNPLPTPTDDIMGSRTDNGDENWTDWDGVHRLHVKMNVHWISGFHYFVLFPFFFFFAC